MAVWEEIRHQVAISGKIMGSSNGKGLGGVRVSIVDGPSEFMDTLVIKQALSGAAWASLSKRPDRVMTEADGHFHFMDLPDGDYTLSGAFPSRSSRYGTVQQIVSVARAPDGHILMAQADMTLPASMIRGKVTRQGSGTAVVMAEVRVQGSGEYTHTDENGDYRLGGVECSATLSRSLIVSARGYQDTNLSVLLATPGEEQVLNVTLTPL